MNRVVITCSIVIFNEDPTILWNTIHSFLNIPFSKKIFIIDNSEISNFKTDLKDVEYIKNTKNIGFGRAHNQAIEKIKGNSDYHLVLNPDVEFTTDSLENLILQLQKNEEVAMISPRVNYPNGALQYTCRMHPTGKEMISRRLGINQKYVHERMYKNKNLSLPFFPDFIHGCFMLFKTKDLIDLGGFDEQYFLYMEDADLCRKVQDSGKKVMYYPLTQITHLYRKGSSKKLKLLYYHITSAIKYFKKWGV